MPELPEVETVVRGLRLALEGEKIARAACFRANLRTPFPDNLADRLEGRTITSLGRRAKYILINLDDGQCWLTHLGMSGSFRILPDAAASATQQAAGRLLDGATAVQQQPLKQLAPPPPRPISNMTWPQIGTHDHFALETTTGIGLRYHDPRRFGFMDLFAQTPALWPGYLQKLGPEPFDSSFTPALLQAGLAKRKGPIKTILLDQTLLVGLGNIYVCEALWRVGIDPQCPADRVAAKGDVAALHQAIVATLGDAVAAGGSSIRDYVQADGELGYFQHQWAAYDRAGEPCRKPGCDGVITRIVQAGRSSFFCPTHQTCPKQARGKR